MRSLKESYTFRNLSPATTYYWQVVGKTMANLTRSGPLWQFTTAGDIAPPPAGGVVPIIADATVRSGGYASANFGAAATLIAKHSTDQQWIRESYLKVDIGGVSATQQVRLRLFGALSDLENQLRLTGAPVLAKLKRPQRRHAHGRSLIRQ